MSNPVPSAQRSGAPALGAPSHTRYFVVVFAVVLAVIQYIDRVSISMVSGDIQRDLGLSQKDIGWAFGAFTLAYALFEIPTGYLGDRIGARKVLIRVVLWWSFFTSATGAVWNFVSLVTVRFLFGVGEAGCFPNIARAFNRGTSMRATGHVSAHDQGLTGFPVATLSPNARSSSTCASRAFA